MGRIGFRFIQLVKLCKCSGTQSGYFIVVTYSSSRLVGTNPSIKHYGDPRTWRGPNSEGPKIEARRAERGGILGDGMFPSHQLGICGRGALKLPTGVWGEPLAAWQFRTFLANVSSRSSSLFAVARPSVVCLSVMLVRPTQAVQIFGNISTALGTMAIR